MGSWGKDNKKHVIARSVATWQSIFFGITRLRRSALPLFRLHTPHNKADPLIADRLPTNAERKGFEPLERKAFNGFRDRPDRPLRHLSFAALKAGSFMIKATSRRLAETEGFEPPKPFGLTVFKTAAIDHSAISPLQKYNNFPLVENFRRKKTFFR